MWVRYPDAGKPLSRDAALGRQLFFDASLSASGKLACASCHDPAHAYGPPNGRAVQIGGPDGKQAGIRAVPSLRYLQFTPRFTRHFVQPSSDGVEDEGPAGGFARDGGAQTLHEQALLPLLNRLEMGNRDLASVNRRLRAAPYADEFRKLYGANVFSRAEDGVGRAALALEAFQSEDPSFRPYTSKFDAVMSGRARFSEQERRGYRLFNDPLDGNCAKCHVNTPGPGGRPAQFTDYGLVALGVLGIRKSPQIGTRSSSTSVRVGRCDRTSWVRPNSAGFSKRRHCATRPSARRSFTTGGSIACGSRCSSTRSETPRQLGGTPRTKGGSSLSTTCPRNTEAP